MDLSMKWLNDYVKADMPIKEFCDGMTMSGSKVENLDKAGRRHHKCCSRQVRCYGKAPRR